MPAVSVILPTYNEKENIAGLIRLMAKSLKGSYEIIVVDDNSPDRTADAVKKMQKYYPLRLIVREKKSGLASAIIEGARNARGKRLVIMDSDMSHPPSAAKEMLEKDADIVIGSRYAAGGGIEGWSFYRKLQSWFATKAAKAFLGTGATDPMSGFFAIDRRILLGTKLSVKGFKILLDILIKNPKASVEEVPYVFQNRKKGKSKLGAVEVKNYCLAIFRLFVYRRLGIH
jgi:dolichol-phosphate mannosyltransferase